MSVSDRIFYRINAESAELEWYFAAREGAIGPFSSEDRAKRVLAEFVKFNAENSSWGATSRESLPFTEKHKDEKEQTLQLNLPMSILS